MTVYFEIALKDFEFWSGAKDLASKLTDEEFDTIEEIISDLYPDTKWSGTAVNDLFWFDGDIIAEWLGYDDEEALLSEREGQ